MTFSIGKSRPYQLSMAAVCTLLASGGFVAAGYVDTSAADAAAARAAQESIYTASSPGTMEPAGFDALAGQDFGVKISFANTLVLSKKSAAKELFDLTDPNGNTSQLARSVDAMRGDIPEISAELISQVRKDILIAAYQGLGHRYVWGGTSFENGWDCSGFVQWAYRQAGVGLPRTEQWLPMVETKNPQPGDIVVQNPDGPNHWSHIGIYIGKGKMISALNPSVGTILHAPADVSSSSTYFTMPAFATADELARAKASASATATPTTGPTATAEPSHAPSASPGSTSPGTTPPTTKPATTSPATTAPGTTNPATTAPGTTNPATTAPGTTNPATTSPATTNPATTAPSTTNPATISPSTSEPDTAEPSTAPPVATEPATTEPVRTASETTASATDDPGVNSVVPSQSATVAPPSSASASESQLGVNSVVPSQIATVAPPSSASASESQLGVKATESARSESAVPSP
ncbi:NlpC/P60 family protein [Arthrobacter alpinus]|uniref:NlpC/P60 family protein n=1 Tax=Arthrobacter alpinus TaxID=656366 RepID=A0A1H5MYG4_9MICC|nr:NlpC/P60 family protein [Arthrobacter alpinus]